MARRTVKVNVGKGYEVIIENGILKNCGSIVKNTVGKNRAAVITDSNVAKLYLDTVLESLKNV
ncbi:MAG: 3-dehydroquinate synthase, partial [Clostridia bacterium]|nr:3-dehydroquinate synthase [Clostridia bacterium]